MMSFVLKRALPVAAALLFCSTFAKAQGGSCHDPWINQGYNVVFHRAPSGSGTTGECNINLYGAGSWTSQQDLFTRIAHSKDCQDPWIGQIYWNLYNRRPNGNECSTYNYGGGQWSSYMDLANKIQAYQRSVASGARPQPPSYGTTPVTGNNGSAPVISSGSSSVISSGSSGLISHDGGSLISHDGGSYRVQSLPSRPHAPAGKYLVAPNGALVDQNGQIVRAAGTYKLGLRNGVLTLSAPGNITPASGSVVNP